MATTASRGATAAQAMTHRRPRSSTPIRTTHPRHPVGGRSAVAPVRPLAFDRPTPTDARSCNATLRSHRSRTTGQAVARTMLLVGVLLGIWFGAGALSSTHQQPTAVVAGSTPVAGGYSYVVRPGDSLWSIATSLNPTGDPRPIVDELASELHGAPLQAGVTLHLP